MVAYTSGDYVYFINMTDNPEINHIGFILNKRHDMYITPQLKIVEETFVSFSELFVKKNLVPWIKTSIQIVDHLSKVNIWNQHNQQMEQMYNRR